MGARVLAVLVAVIAGCGRPVRGEIVLFVDTDLRVPEDVDTLVVEVFDRGATKPLERREVTVATADRWPVSFGLAADDTESTPSFRVRLTAYPAWSVIDPLRDVPDPAAAAPAACPDGTEGEDPAPLVDPDALPELPAPLPQYVTSRLADLRVVAGEVVGRSVVLRASCLASVPGRPDDAKTCVDGAPGSPSKGVADVDPNVTPASAVGRSPLVAEAGCAEPDVDGIAGRRCVRGGLGYLGDARFHPVNPKCVTCSDVPPVPEIVAPFLIDTYEVTIGRVGDAMTDPDPARAFHPTSPLPTSPHPLGPGDDPLILRCTWPSDAATVPISDPTARRFPLVCVPSAFADEFCRWAGGSLPSEAQWYRAAKGPNGGSFYPWGDVLPTCADPSRNEYPPCDPEAPFPIPVDSYPGDVSPDGVIGLSSLVSELTADVAGAVSRPGCRRSSTRGLGLLAYTGPIVGDGPCTCAGALASPDVASPAKRLHSRINRGGSWFFVPDLRFRDVTLDTIFSDPHLGFRCVYPATPGAAP